MIKKATLNDAKKIQDLILVYSEKDLMLPRSINEIYEHIRDFAVYDKDNNIVGCCGLQTYMDSLSEIKALAVAEEYKHQNIGTRLVEFSLGEAKELKSEKVFVLTYIPEFFEQFGFRKMDKAKLPHKIWRECVKCPKFPDCDEVALIKEISS